MKSNTSSMFAKRIEYARRQKNFFMFFFQIIKKEVKKETQKSPKKESRNS